jgi:hypothetical protein
VEAGAAVVAGVEAGAVVVEVEAGAAEEEGAGDENCAGGIADASVENEVGG